MMRPQTVPEKFLTVSTVPAMPLILSEPIWLDSNVAEFKRHSKVRFYQDNFIDSIDFSYMEIQVIEED